MLENIELFGNSLGVNNESVLQNIFDVIHPIGEVYVQYPQQLSPYDLYNNDKIKSVWEEQLQYDGAFFRASNDTTSDNNHVYKVNDETQYYQLDSNNYPTIPVKVIGDSGGTITVTQDGNSITYEGKTYIRYVINNATRRASSYINETNGLVKQNNQNQYHNHTINHAHGITDPGHKHTCSVHNSGTGSPKINGSNNTLWETINTSTDKTGITVNQHTGSSGYNGSSTDTESRPDNYTYKVWKRIN